MIRTAIVHRLDRFPLFVLSLLVLISGVLAPVTATAEVKSRKIEYQQGGVELAGHMAWDDSIRGKRPGVLVVHEWWGLDDYARGRAEQLAKMGYVAFALDMYGEGKLAEHPKEAAQWSSEIRSNVDQWMARATAGLEILRKHDLVDADRVAAIGYCFGGATVVELAYHGAPLRGVASFHGSLPVWDEDKGGSVSAAILACHGADDPFVPAEKVTQFQDGLKKAKADWQLIVYSDARHSFTNPAADSHGLDGLKYSRRADQLSWQHMQVFFDRIFDKSE